MFIIGVYTSTCSQFILKDSIFSWTFPALIFNSTFVIIEEIFLELPTFVLYETIHSEYISSWFMSTCYFVFEFWFVWNRNNVSLWLLSTFLWLMWKSLWWYRILKKQKQMIINCTIKICGWSGQQNSRLFNWGFKIDEKRLVSTINISFQGWRRGRIGNRSTAFVIAYSSPCYIYRSVFTNADVFSVTICRYIRYHGQGRQWSYHFSYLLSYIYFILYP